jgi:hypothetical protein
MNSESSATGTTQTATQQQQQQQQNSETAKPLPEAHPSHCDGLSLHYLLQQQEDDERASVVHQRLAINNAGQLLGRANLRHRMEKEGSRVAVVQRSVLGVSCVVLCMSDSPSITQASFWDAPTCSKMSTDSSNAIVSATGVSYCAVHEPLRIK